MSEDALYELLTMTESCLPDENAVRNTIEKFSILDAPAIVSHAMKIERFKMLVPLISDAMEDMDTKRITEYVISFFNPYYPTVIKEITANEQNTQLRADVVKEGIKVIRDGNY